MSTFSENLSKIMEDRGISQKWLAEASNTTEATISRYANNVHKPTLDIVIAIAQALGVSVDYLVGFSPLPSPQGSYTTDELLLVKCYRRASNRDQNLVWGILQEYARSPEEEAFLSQQLTERRSV